MNQRRAFTSRKDAGVHLEGHPLLEQATRKDSLSNLSGARRGLAAAGLLSDHQLDCSDRAGEVGSVDGGSFLIFSVQR